jgi:hypothetical protein
MSRIYIRVGDASDPEAAKDQATILQLAKRQERWKEVIRALVDVVPLTSEDESALTIVSLYLLADPLVYEGTSLKFDDFVEVATEGLGPFAGMPFEAVSSGPRGFIARSIGDGRQPERQAITFRHFYDGSSIIQVPLSMGQIRTDGLLVEPLKNYQQAGEFIEACLAAGVESCLWLDLNYLLVAFAEAIAKHRRLLELGGLRDNTHFKVRVQNCWHRVPFVDSHHYVEMIQKHGVPIVQDQDMLIPGIDYEDMMALSRETVSEEEVPPNYRLLMVALKPWINTLRALGLEYLGDPSIVLQVLSDMYKGVAQQAQSRSC